jgi:hypothetical protein
MSAIEDRKGNEKVKQSEAELKLTKMKKNVSPSKTDKTVNVMRDLKKMLDRM